MSDAEFLRRAKPVGSRPIVAVVDYGMGNLFSVKHACRDAGLDAVITSSAQAVRAADAVILPGVGAFGNAMVELKRRGVLDALKEAIESGKPFLGICLGMQLLMSESEEFGNHRGLEIIKGRVVRLSPGMSAGRRPKVPQVGWNRIHQAPGRSWDGTLLAGVPDGGQMYFVHSYYVITEDPALSLSLTRYGTSEFCSSLQSGNVTACQFHPERSGPLGLLMYRNLALQLSSAIAEAPHV